MKPQTCCKVGAWGAAVPGLCCIGLLGLLLTAFGATTALFYVNQYGDFVFLPSYAIFATLLVYGLLSLKKKWYSYAITAVVAGIAVWFSLTLMGALLVLGGIAVGALLIWKFGGK